MVMAIVLQINRMARHRKCTQVKCRLRVQHDFTAGQLTCFVLTLGVNTSQHWIHTFPEKHLIFLRINAQSHSVLFAVFLLFLTLRVQVLIDWQNHSPLLSSHPWIQTFSSGFLFLPWGLAVSSHMYWTQCDHGGPTDRSVFSLIMLKISKLDKQRNLTAVVWM